ncbi:peroxidase, partial [Acinetobacter baumannii]|nr:peroxidase [Acinetobacter baumannii]
QGNEIKKLAHGESGHDWYFNNQPISAQSTLREMMTKSIKNHKAKKSEKKSSKRATRAQINELIKWLDQSTGRGTLLTQKLECSPSFISQIKNFTRPCSAENYKKIKEAILEIEQDEKK